MIKIERLQAAEYPILRTLPDAICPNPSTSIALVARDRGRIVGRNFLISLAHTECIWVDPDYRKTSLGARLMREAELLALNAGDKSLFAYGASEELEGYLSRLGYSKLPLTIWQKDLL